MFRASLPIAGVAAALLVASVAVGQTPQFSADPPVHYLGAAWPRTAWQVQSEWHHPLLDMMGETQLVSFEVVADEEKPRLKPAPQQTKEPAVACPNEVVEEVIEDAPCFSCMPFFLPPPQQPPQSSGHKCHLRKQRGCQGGSNQGGYGQGYGYPNPGWGYGMGGYAAGWGGGMDGGFGCFYPPPYPPQQNGSGHKCRHKQGGCQQGGQTCPRCGYPGYGGYGYGPQNGGAYPVAGWSTMNDGLNSFTDPNCLNGNQGCGHGRCRKCHKQQQQPQGPPPYPYWPIWQPCCGMDGFSSF